MKKSVAILLTVSMILGNLYPVYADDSKEDEVENTKIEVNTNNEVKNLSIDDAVKLAIEVDREMWKINDGIRQVNDSRKQGKAAKDLAEMIKGTTLEEFDASSINQLDLVLANNDYYSIYANEKVKQMEKSKEELTKGIEISVKSLYYSILTSEKAIEINSSKLTRAEEQLRVVKLKFDSGTATKAEVLSAEMSVQQAKTDLDSATDELEIAKLNLINKLDLPLDTKINLTDKTIKYESTKNINLEESIKRAKEERPEILKAISELAIQEVETKAYKGYYTSNLRQYKSAVEKLKDAELAVPQSYKDVELDVRKSYLNLIKAERELENMDATLKLAEESARMNKLLYENGMATLLDVLETDTQYAQAEIGKYQLLVSYNISKMMFDNSNIISNSK